MCSACQKGGSKPLKASNWTMNFGLADTIEPPSRTIRAVMVSETGHPWHQEKNAATSGVFDQAESALNSRGEAT